jgi:signal transduction histidine kinase
MESATAQMDPQVVQMIAASRDKFRALVDGMDDDIMSVDAGFRVVTVNKALALRLNLHPREVVGRLCHEVLHGMAEPCSHDGRRCPVPMARATHQVQVEIHQQPDPEPDAPGPRFMEVRAMPVPGSNDHGDETIVVQRDVTPQKRAEQQLKDYSQHLEHEVARRTTQLRQANEELTRANEELLALQRLKEDLIHMVVHDLKGPLAEIQANLAMAATSTTEAFQAEVLDAARLGSNDLERMILNLLDVSRLEENRIFIEAQELNPAAFVKEILDRHDPLAKLHEVQMSLDVPLSAPAVYADPILLRRVFYNLLHNALDHTPEGGRINVGLEWNDDEFQFLVQDTGKGIPKEFHEKIFEKFSQGDRGRPKTGSGLGLTFCRLAITAHGGRIWVESEPGRGSRFLFTIPRPNTLEGAPETIDE